VRWPGSFGSAFLCYVAPRVILFREEHSPRVLVEKVDFISALGTSAAGIYRVGGPYALPTGAALFAFEKEKGRFRLDSVHAGTQLALTTRLD
jgi:glutaconate CoA-transferase, subunit B